MEVIFAVFGVWFLTLILPILVFAIPLVIFIKWAKRKAKKSGLADELKNMFK